MGTHKSAIQQEIDWGAHFTGRGKKSTKKSGSDYISVSATKAFKEKLSEYQGNESDAWAVLENFLAHGYRVSIRWSDYNDAYSITMYDGEKAWSKVKKLSYWSASLEDVCRGLAVALLLGYLDWELEDFKPPL